jgi:hypothetical protein
LAIPKEDEMAKLFTNDPDYMRLYAEACVARQWGVAMVLERMDHRLRWACEDAAKYHRLWETADWFNRQQAALAARYKQTRPVDHRAPTEASD